MALRINVNTISSHQHHCHRYHSVFYPSAASEAPSSVCNTVDDANTFVEVAVSCHHHHHLMHRKTHCHRSIDWADRWTSQLCYSLVSICRKLICQSRIYVIQSNDFVRTLLSYFETRFWLAGHSDSAPWQASFGLRVKDIYDLKTSALSSVFAGA